MKKQLFVLCGWIVFAPTAAPAQIQMGKAWARPPGTTLYCRRDYVIHDRQTVAEIAARLGIVGNIQRISELIGQMDRAPLWEGRGSGASRVYSITLPYWFVYRAPIEFGVRLRDTVGMTIEIERRVQGDLDTFINRNAAKYLSPDRAKIVKDMREQFHARRRAEVAALLRWNDTHYTWNQKELGQGRVRTDGVFSRSVPYGFCDSPDNAYRATFHAAWRGSLGANRSR